MDQVSHWGRFSLFLELGLYYLKSRYYDPEICRFINADDTSMLGAGGGFVSYNLFAYCGDNPVNKADDGGEFPNIVIGAFVGAAIGAFVCAGTQLAQDKNSWKTKEFWGHVAVSAGSGAISGSFAATGIGLAGQVVINATLGATSGVVDTAIDADQSTIATDYLKSALIGGVLGAGAGLLGGPGTATRHMQSSFRTALNTGNWRYYSSQTSTEAIRAGKEAISSIIKGAIPSISHFLYSTLRKGEVQIIG